MRIRHRVVLVSAVVACLGIVLGVLYFILHLPPPASPSHGDPFNPSTETGPVVAATDYRISGPHTHANLSVYLIHGRDTLAGKSYLTLGEALEQGKAVVHETGTVAELSIENLSPDQDLYVQSGDIVKGGQQDRTFPSDLVIAPRSGRVPIASFCVEQGRWKARGNESMVRFGTSKNAVASNDLKRVLKGARGGASQGKVWKDVSRTQDRLSAKLGESVQSGDSTSSLQLSLETPRLKEVVAPYLRHLATVVDGKDDVIGVAFTINGKIMAADVYASNALFHKLWPKLLESTAIEAIAERQDGTNSSPLDAEAVKTFLTRAESTKAASEPVTERIFTLSHVAAEQLLFDTCDRAQDNLVIHRSFLAR
jgi:hypothetical protein